MQVALAQFNGLDLGTTLILTGIYNFISGALFSLPMPVQPMKSIAAIALSENPLSLAQIVAAGMCVSIVVLFLGATGLINVFNRLVRSSDPPLSVLQKKHILATNTIAGG